MKLLLAILMVCSVCFGVSSDSASAQGAGTRPEFKHKFQITTKYDKGKDTTTVALKPIAITTAMAAEVTDLKQVPQIDLEIYFTYQGQSLSKPVTQATLALHSVSPNIVYRQSQDLIAVLNNASYLPLGTTNYKSISKTFMFEEILSIPLPIQAMKKLSDAKNFELVLGHQRELKLTEPQMEAFRDMTSRMTP